MPASVPELRELQPQRIETRNHVPTNPTRLPGKLFEAICQRDKGDIKRWARKASAWEISHVTQSLREDPWCALTSRGTVLGAMARYGETVPTFLMHTCVRDPDLLQALAWNKSLTPLQVEVIGQHLMAVLGKPSWPLESLAAAVEGLCTLGYIIPPIQLQGLIQTATRGEVRFGKPDSVHFRLPIEDRRAMRAVNVLAHIPQLGSPHLADIVANVGLPETLVRKFLIEHPAADKKVWVSALSCSFGAVAKYAPALLAEYGPAANDPEVRELLKKNADPKVFLSLLSFPQGDVVFLLRRLKQLSPLEAARLLADGPEEIRAEAPRDLIVDLLKNSDQQVRATAFRALGTAPGVPPSRRTPLAARAPLGMEGRKPAD